MTPAEIGLTVAGAVALVTMCCWISFDEGRRRAMAEVDGMFETAKALGAYGYMLRVESEALGTTVEKLVARDARNYGGAR